MQTTKIDLNKLFEGKEPVERDEENDGRLEAFDRAIGDGREPTVE